MRQTVLLHTHVTTRRLLQTVMPLLGTALLLAGVAVMVGRQATMQGSLAIAVGAGLMIAASRVTVAWDVPYKGHVIRFTHHVVFGDRLAIDGARVTGGLAGRRTLLGVIRAGDGAGERIRAESEAGLTILRVKILAESHDPG
jgi:hypothetical protein